MSYIDKWNELIKNNKWQKITKLDIIHIASDVINEKQTELDFIRNNLNNLCKNLSKNNDY